MDTNKLVSLINSALNEADDYVLKYYDGNEKPMLNTKKTLFLLKEEIQKNSTAINVRVLRAMHDIAAISVKAYENTSLDDVIGNIFSTLYNTVPVFKNLQPLGMDFGEGDPI